MTKRRANIVGTLKILDEENNNDSFMTLDEAVMEKIEDYDNELRDRLFSEKDNYEMFEKCAKDIHDLFFKKLDFSKTGNVMFFNASPIPLQVTDNMGCVVTHETNEYKFTVFGREIENLIFRNLEFYTRTEQGKLKAVFEPNDILKEHLLRNGISDLKIVSVKDRKDMKYNTVSSSELFTISFTDVRYFNEYSKDTYWLLKDEIEYKLSTGWFKD